jgi:hypothetical protein
MSSYIMAEVSANPCRFHIGYNIFSNSYTIAFLDIKKYFDLKSLKVNNLSANSSYHSVQHYKVSPEREKKRESRTRLHVASLIYLNNTYKIPN